MTDRQAEQATAEEVRGLVMADVRGGADLRPAVITATKSNGQRDALRAAGSREVDEGTDGPGHAQPRPIGPCPGCGRGAGLWCAPWCEYADPGEPCPDCSAAGDCHPWCPRREEAPSE